MTGLPPLILTLQLDSWTFAYFNDLRQQHFPAKINYLDAHLTLFHHLPNSITVQELVKIVAENQNIIPLAVAAVVKLGSGVAYKIESPALMGLHKYLKQEWQQWLNPQDQQGFRPHITVQNKVEPVTARILFEELSAAFVPFIAEGTGLNLWEYHRGPWQKIQDYNFRVAAAG